jgi:hypothetical protein
MYALLLEVGCDNGIQQKGIDQTKAGILRSNPKTLMRRDLQRKKQKKTKTNNNPKNASVLIVS